MADAPNLPAPTRRSPLGTETTVPVLLADAPGVSLRELPFVTQLDLRLDPAGRAAASVTQGLGLELPATPNLVVADGSGRRALWLGPDEWLLVAPADDPRWTARALAPAAEAQDGSILDLSAARACLELRGPAARQVLEEGCSIDLHPRAFAVDACAQTLLARVDVVLDHREPEAFAILVRTSFAPYLVTWLTRVMGPG